MAKQAVEETVLGLFQLLVPNRALPVQTKAQLGAEKAGKRPEKEEGRVLCGS
jgi:hypothetical protein